jgi:hypothetical protein
MARPRFGIGTNNAKAPSAAILPMREPTRNFLDDRRAVALADVFGE